MDGWDYIVECRWRTKLAEVGDFDVLIARPGNPTMGFFLAINGWSAHVLPAIKQNPSKSIILHGRR